MIVTRNFIYYHYKQDNKDKGKKYQLLKLRIENG